MVLLSSPVCEFGKKMPEFVLKDLDGNFFDSTKIENYNAILESLEKEKSNNTLKGDLIKSAFITSTMGVSYKLKIGKNI